MQSAWRTPVGCRLLYSMEADIIYKNEKTSLTNAAILGILLMATEADCKSRRCSWNHLFECDTERRKKMKNVLKKFIVLIMSVLMLFTAVPVRALAACDHCNHAHVDVSAITEKEVHGYTHHYTTLHGGAGGCTVRVFERSYTETCRSCGFVKTLHLPNREEHSSNHK